MNPPSSSRPGSSSSQQLRGCEGDGCGSAPDTWPLHHVYRRGVRSRLCSSCILLSHRSYYCCSCFFLIPCPALWGPDDEVAHLVAPTAPIATCEVCREAIAHLACLRGPANGGATAAFFCPACRAAEEGRPFTYVPPCSTPLDERGARVLVLGARLALLLLRWNADVARAEAERLARNAVALRRTAYQALGVAMEFDTEAPSWNIDVVLPEGQESPPRPSSENRRLERGEGSGTTCVVNAPPPSPPPDHQQLRRAMPLPPMPALSIGGRGNVTQMAMAATEAARDGLPPRPPRPPRTRTLPLFGVAEAATVAEASTSRPPTPPTLQLFPVKASSSGSRPKRRMRTLQLFQDTVPDDEEMQ